MVSVCKVFASLVIGDVHVLRHSTGTQEWCRCFNTSPESQFPESLKRTCYFYPVVHQKWSTRQFLPECPTYPVSMCVTLRFFSFHQTPPENISFITNTFIPCSTAHFNQTIRRYIVLEIYQHYAIKDLMMLPPYKRA